MMDVEQDLFMISIEHYSKLQLQVIKLMTYLLIKVT